MDAFSVMLKGRDGDDAYHITVSVAHHTAEAAEELACDYASQEGWNIVEIEETGSRPSNYPVLFQVLFAILLPVDHQCQILYQDPAMSGNSNGSAPG